MHSTRSSIDFHRAQLREALVKAYPKDGPQKTLFNQWWQKLCGTVETNKNFLEEITQEWFKFKQYYPEESKRLENDKMVLLLLKYLGVLYWQAWFLDMAPHHLENKKTHGKEILNQCKDHLQGVNELKNKVSKLETELKSLDGIIQQVSFERIQEGKQFGIDDAIEHLKDQFKQENDIIKVKLKSEIAQFESDFKKLNNDLLYETDGLELIRSRDELIRQLNNIKLKATEHKIELPLSAIDQIFQIPQPIEEAHQNKIKRLQELSNEHGVISSQVQNKMSEIEQFQTMIDYFFLLTQDEKEIENHLLVSFDKYKNLKREEKPITKQNFIFWIHSQSILYKVHFPQEWKSVIALIEKQFDNVAGITFQPFQELSRQATEQSAEMMLLLKKINVKQFEQGFQETKVQIEAEYKEYLMKNEQSKQKALQEFELIKSEVENQKQKVIAECDRRLELLQGLSLNAIAVRNSNKEAKRQRDALVNALVPTSLSVPSSQEFKLASPKPMTIASASTGVSSVGSIAGGVVAFFAMASNPIGWGLGLLGVGVAFGIAARVFYVKSKNRQIKNTLLDGLTPQHQEIIAESNRRIKQISSRPLTREMRHVMAQHRVIVDPNQSSRVEDGSIVRCKVVGRSDSVPLFLDYRRRELFFKFPGEAAPVLVTKDSQAFDNNIARACARN